MQVILGAGGTIARGIARLLPQHTDKVRLVSRNPKKVNEGDELLQADLKDLNAVMNAIKGADVVYLTAGLKYDIKVWLAPPAIPGNHHASGCAPRPSFPLPGRPDRMTIDRQE